jgi:putative membrane protein
VYEHLPAGARPATEEGLQQATLLLHYAYGGAAGALFTLMAPSRLPAAVGAGILFGLTVWSGSYLGLLPALGVRHHARHDPAGRSAMMIAAHIVWGATLGLVLRGRPGLRAASADPDSPR